MLGEFLTVSRDAALTAGNLLMDYYGKTTGTLKADKSMVTEADLEADKLIRETLSSNFPGHSILSEESGMEARDDEYLWVIDPLDGTANFSASVPFFAVSIALVHRGIPLAGVVHAPFQGELFHAVKGEGSFLNGKKLGIKNDLDLETSFLSFCNGADQEVRERMIRIYSRLKPLNNTVRHLGAPALELCYVAAGRFSAFIMPGAHSWDVAAGTLIVEEAGGIVSDFQRGAFTLTSADIMAAQHYLHEKLLKIVENALTT
ncbi:MAG: inositol monophosphatase family protein [Candidatus Odinarchaeota archaeon]